MTLKSILLAAGAALSLIASPASAVVFVAGDVFAAVGGGLVRHYSSAGVLKDTLNTTRGGFTTGMAFDTAGNLYVSNFSDASVAKFSNTGVLLAGQYISGTGGSPESIVFNAAGEMLLGGPNVQLKRYSSTGTFLQNYGATRVDFIDLAADQKTVFVTEETSIIKRFDISTNSALSNFVDMTANGGTNGFALRILDNGDVLIAGGPKVLQYSAAGAFLGSYDVTGVDSFFALNLDSTNNTFWSGSFGNNNLYRFTLGNYGANVSSQTIVAGGQLFGVAVFGERTVAVPLVPEPGTWAMMIAGFGIVGGLARSRRRRASAALV
jgi:PEP-CTERM motif